MLPLFIELKAPTKGNKFKVELSQISTHLRIKANNYVSFFLVRHPQTKALYLFEGGKLCTFLASQTLATLLVSEASEGFLIRGSLEEVLALANQKARSLSQGK
jgi:penicillin-binding protein-related factor A (putative recombinase)